MWRGVRTRGPVTARGRVTSRARPRTKSDLSLKTATDGARTYWRHGDRRGDADVCILARTAKTRSKQPPLRQQLVSYEHVTLQSKLTPVLRRNPPKWSACRIRNRETVGV